MAIDQGTETITLASEERTWRVNIETAKGGDPVVTVHRETVKSDSAGVVSKAPAGTVTRSLSATSTQTVTIGAKTLSVAELAMAVALLADMWRAEDLSKPAPAGPRRT